MPAHPMHLTVDLLILGKGYPEIHKFLDQFQNALQSGHRAYYHDTATIETILYYTGDPMAGASAYLHILLDLVSDKVGQDASVATLVEMWMRGMI
jgi:hypothetical protein